VIAVSTRAKIKSATWAIALPATTAVAAVAGTVAVSMDGRVRWWRVESGVVLKKPVLRRSMARGRWVPDHFAARTVVREEMRKEERRAARRVEPILKEEEGEESKARGSSRATYMLTRANALWLI